MAISYPAHWKEPYLDQGPKYDKICEMIDDLNTFTEGECYWSQTGNDLYYNTGKVINQIDSAGFWAGALAGGDVGLYHNGTNSVLENKTGHMLFQTPTAKDFLFYLGGNFVVNDLDDGNVALLTLVTNAGSRYFQIGQAADSVISYFYGHISIPVDSQMLYIGAGNDLQLWHNGANTFIQNITGQLTIYGAAGQRFTIGETSGAYAYLPYENGYFYFSSDNHYFRAQAGGSAWLTINSTGLTILNAGAGADPVLWSSFADKRLAVDSHFQIGGKLQVGGNLMFSGILDSNWQFATGYYLETDGDVKARYFISRIDGFGILLGAGDDLAIYHSGSHSYVAASNTGNLYLSCSSGNILVQAPNNNVYLDGNGYVYWRDAGDGYTNRATFDYSTGTFYLYKIGAPLQLTAAGSTQVILYDSTAGADLKRFGLQIYSGNIRLCRHNDAWDITTPLLTFDTSNNATFVNSVTITNDLFITDELHFNKAGQAIIRSDVKFLFLTDAGSAQAAHFKGIQVSTSYAGSIPDNGILFSTDTNLYRSDVNVLKTDDSFFVVGNVGLGVAPATYQLKIKGNVGYYQALFEGGWAGTVASDSRCNLNDTNFGIGAGRYEVTASHDALVLWSYGGANRGILFASTTAGSTTAFLAMQHNMFIDGDTGYVGIGTVDPSIELDVVGGISLTGTFSFDTGVGVIEILDEDDMASNSATALATQQSIKAFGDSIAAGGLWTLTGADIYRMSKVGIQDSSPTETLDVGGTIGCTTLKPTSTCVHTQYGATLWYSAQFAGFNHQGYLIRQTWASGPSDHLAFRAGGSGDNTIEFLVCESRIQINAIGSPDSPQWWITNNGYVRVSGSTFGIYTDTSNLGFLMDDDGSNTYWKTSTRSSLYIEVPSGTTVMRLFNTGITLYKNTTMSGAAVISSTDGDYTHYFGRAAVGYGGGYSDYAWFSHRDRVSAGNYAVLQSSAGYTFINASSGASVFFRIGNTDVMTMSGTGLHCNTISSYTDNDQKINLYPAGNQIWLHPGAISTDRYWIFNYYESGSANPSLNSSVGGTGSIGNVTTHPFIFYVDYLRYDINISVFDEYDDLALLETMDIERDKLGAPKLNSAGHPMYDKRTQPSFLFGEKVLDETDDLNKRAYDLASNIGFSWGCIKQLHQLIKDQQEQILALTDQINDST